MNPFQRGPGPVVGPGHPVLRVALPALLLAMSVWLVPSLLERTGDTVLSPEGLPVVAAVSVALAVGSTRWPLLGWQLVVGVVVGLDVLLLVHGLSRVPNVGIAWFYVMVVWLPLPALIAWTTRGRVLTAALSATCLVALLTIVTALGPGGARFYLQDIVAFSLMGAAPLALALVVRGFARSRDRADAAEQRTREEREARAALAERTRIAQEMHDVVAHHFSEVAVRGETAPYRLPDLPEAAVAELRAVAASAREAMGDLRRLLGVLGSPHEAIDEVPQPGLADLEDLLQRARAAGTDVTWELEAEAPVPDVIGLTVYRVVAQALSNARQHAALAPVSVHVSTSASADGGALDVDVLNAAGIDHGPGAGLGLASLRERVAALDGVLTAGPTDDGGWELRARLPLPLPAQEATRV
ncbi:Signal transduction histidine kinase [Quadrisphaera granulorum]|uniref:histidine kinase n=1 Tax=Quadrisphaera granulorum TaxID=317664 RepID=A0A316A8G1_9ACTN|nr:signal transduction histidine kinase [Quadrisphaera granulorum]SZE96810.1 Signal transduction histidine kinase [Quadrisphaera granulorum]